jgi:hypothetical protein
MRNISTKFIVGALSLGAVLLVGTASASASTIKSPASHAPVASARQFPVSGQVQPANNYMGCPSGYGCMYAKNAGWNGGVVQHKWMEYGAHNLSDITGTHRFFNNQTGNAEAALCTGYNGTGTCYYVPAGYWVDYDFTPINSVLLAPAGS